MTNKLKPHLFHLTFISLWWLFCKNWIMGCQYFLSGLFLANKIVYDFQFIFFSEAWFTSSKAFGSFLWQHTDVVRNRIWEASSFRSYQILLTAWWMNELRTTICKRGKIFYHCSTPIYHDTHANESIGTRRILLRLKRFRLPLTLSPSPCIILWRQTVMECL